MKLFFMNNIKRVKSLAAVVSAAAVVFCAFAGPLAASASSADAKKRLEDLQRQAEETNAAIDQAVKDKAAAAGRAADAAADAADASATVKKYQSLLSEVENNISAANTEIAATQADMDTVTAELGEAEAAIDVQYAAMKKRIAYIYENRKETNLLYILFTSGSIASALNQADEVEALMSYDRQALAKYKELKVTIETKKEELAQKQSDLSAYQGILTASQDKYSALRTAAGVDLADANAAASDAAGDLAAADASIAALQKKKKALDSQAAAAQAAYAKAILAEQEAQEQKNGGKHEDTSAAVSASADDVTFLAATIQAEAWNQGYAGQLAVGSVIMNRVNSSLFPNVNTIREVITAPKQFSSYSSGMVDKYIERGVDAQCLKVAQEVIAGKRSGDWLFFMTKKAADGFRIAEYEQIGDHVFFYKWKTKPKETAPAETQPAAPAENSTPADAGQVASSDAAAESKAQDTGGQ